MNPQKSILEGICQEAIVRLRKNQGCDIDFGSLDEQPSFSGDVLLAKIYTLRMKIHGENFVVAMQSSYFEQDIPRDDDEARIYNSTRGDKRAMIILRIGKLIFNYYKEWLNQHGLGTKATKQPTLATALDGTYTRSTLSDVSDTVSDIKNKLDYSEQEVDRLKNILSDTRDEKAKLEVEVQNLKDQLNIIMQRLYDKGVL